MFVVDGLRRLAVISTIGVSTLILASCFEAGPVSGAPETPYEVKPEFAFERYHFWFAAGGAEAQPTNAGADLKLIKGGLAAAIFSNMPTFPGDHLMVTAHVNGPIGQEITTILQRHCDADNGGDATIQRVVLTGELQRVSVEHTFTQYYSCWRLAFTSQSETPVMLTISNLEYVASP